MTPASDPDEISSMTQTMNQPMTQPMRGGSGS